MTTRPLTESEKIALVRARFHPTANLSVQDRYLVRFLFEVGPRITEALQEVVGIIRRPKVRLAFSAVEPCVERP